MEYHSVCVADELVCPERDAIFEAGHKPPLHTTKDLFYIVSIWAPNSYGTRSHSASPE